MVDPKNYRVPTKMTDGREGEGVISSHLHLFISAEVRDRAPLLIGVAHMANFGLTRISCAYHTNRIHVLFEVILGAPFSLCARSQVFLLDRVHPETNSLYIVRMATEIATTMARLEKKHRNGVTWMDGDI